MIYLQVSWWYAGGTILVSMACLALAVLITRWIVLANLERRLPAEYQERLITARRRSAEWERQYWETREREQNLAGLIRAASISINQAALTLQGGRDA